MQRILMGSLMGLLSLPLAASVDGTVYDFLRDSADLSSDDLRDLEEEVETAMAELKAESSDDSSREDKEKLKKLEAEVRMGAAIQKDVRGRMSDSSRWEAQFRKSDSVFNLGTNAQTSQLGSKLNDPKYLETIKENDSKTINSMTMSLDPKLPFKVEQSLQVVGAANGKHKVVLSSKLVYDSSIARDQWPVHIKNEFKNLTDEEISSYVETHLNPELEKEPFELGDVDSLKNEASLKKAMDDLPKNASKHIATELFGSASASVMNTASKKRLEDLGGRNRELSEIWTLSRKIDRHSNPKEKAAEMEDLRAKLKVAEALSKDAKLARKAKDGETCEVLVDVLKKEGMKKLSKDSKMDCESYFEAEEVAKEEKSKDEEIQETAQKQDLERAEKISDGLDGLRAHCAQLKQAASMRQKQVEEQIAPLFLALTAVDAQTFKCKLMGTLAGDLAMDKSNDPILAAMSKDNPFLNQGIPSEEDLVDKSKRIASSATKDLKGIEELNQHKKCIAESLGLAGATIHALETFGQEWAQLKPEEYKKSMQRAQEIQSMSKALVQAISDELDLRNASGTGSIRAMASDGSGSAGQVRSLGSAIGQGTAVRRRLTNDTRTERGLSSGKNNGTRTNSGTGAGAPGRLPPPNFLGE